LLPLDRSSRSFTKLREVGISLGRLSRGEDVDELASRSLLTVFSSQAASTLSHRRRRTPSLHSRSMPWSSTSRSSCESEGGTLRRRKLRSTRCSLSSRRPAYLTRLSSWWMLVGQSLALDRCSRDMADLFFAHLKMPSMPPGPSSIPRDQHEPLELIFARSSPRSHQREDPSLTGKAFAVGGGVLTVRPCPSSFPFCEDW
jgi:hypothetical protein